MFESKKFYRTTLLPTAKAGADELRAELASPLSHLLVGEGAAPP